MQPEHNIPPEVDSYWMVEIRLSNTAQQGARYLCHADNRRDAGAQAKTLMGSDSDVRGFTYYRIDGRALDTGMSGLPALGMNRPVLDQGEWTRLMAAHDASRESALA